MAIIIIIIIIRVSFSSYLYPVTRYNKFNSPDKNVRVDFWDSPTDHLTAHVCAHSFKDG